MNPQAEERVCWTAATNHRPPTKDIQLDSLQAQRWLEYLEQRAPCGEHARALAEFGDMLADALWLARWKREYVVMELELAVVPSLIAAIAGGDSSWPANGSLDIQEDILAALSKMSGWT